MNCCCGSLNDRMQDFWDEQAEWSEATFGPTSERGPLGPLKHLKKEVVNEAIPIAEVLKEGVEGEFALMKTTARLQEEIVDCLFLTIDAARRSGLQYDQFLSMAFEKLDRNKLRTWVKTNNDEPVEHDRSGE